MRVIIILFINEKNQTLACQEKAITLEKQLNEEYKN